MNKEIESSELSESDLVIDCIYKGGNPNISPDRDLVAFWRTMDDKRFQNYEAYFTVLDTGAKPISRKWIESLIYSHEHNLDCALEEKLYDEKNGVGVRQMSRLISRIRYRQIGLLVTTNYVDTQAYKKIVEDGHPILIVTVSDIASILRKADINSSNIDKWLDSIKTTD